MSLHAVDPKLARRVGALALLVLAVSIAGLVFLLDRLTLGSPIRVRVMFRHTAGLRDHAAVIVAGQPIGAIESILPVPQPSPLLDGNSGVAVTVAIAAGDAWKVPARADIIVASRGPLSDKYLEVVPPRGDPGPSVHDGQALRGIDPPSIDNVLQRSWANMTTFKLFVEDLRPELTRLRAALATLRSELAARDGTQLADLAAATGDLVDAARSTYTTSLGGDPGLAALRATLHDARRTVAELRAALDLLSPDAATLAGHTRRVYAHLTGSAVAGPAGPGPASPGTLARASAAVAAARAALARLDPMLAAVSDLADRIASGEGSLARILRDPEFPEDAKDLGKAIKRRPWRILERPAD